MLEVEPNQKYSNKEFWSKENQQTEESVIYRHLELKLGVLWMMIKQSSDCSE